MDRDTYLKRINFTGKIVVDDTVLFQLHEHHLFHVPFENLDIHFKKIFDLEPENIYNKVALKFRGGFCYELNSMFNWLLRDIGFKSTIISSRVFDDSGNLGPEYDHMSIYIETNKRYLADVGFGDLFLRPLEITQGIQSDGRNLFKIEKINEQDYILSMSSDEKTFHKKYAFNLKEVLIENFHAICLDKQTNPMSYFVKNTVCTIPTSSGRLTLLNNRLTEKRDNERIEILISGDEELKAALRTRFGMVIA